MADQAIPRSNAPHNDLTAWYVRSILDYDPNTGVFRWKRRSDVGEWWNRRYEGAIAGRTTEGHYVGIAIHKRFYQAHRLAHLYMTGEWPDVGVDHRRGNKRDNRWDEIRPASKSENGSNAKRRSDNTSGHKGVAWYARKGKWMVRINIQKKPVFLGYFADFEQACAAYKEAATRLHGAFARIE